MPDYSHGKIYKIVSPNHTKVYIGSTVKTLAQRFSQHKNDRTYSSVEIIDVGGADIKLIEDFPCLDKYQLEDREAEIQLMDWDGCVNKNVAGAIRRAGGMKAYKKIYDKSYREENKAKIQCNNKTYREANSKKIKAKKNEICKCFCGESYTRSNKGQHLRSKKHQNFVEIISMV